MASAQQLRVGLPIPFGTDAATFAAHTLNETTDQWEAIVYVPQGKIITQLGFRYSAQTGTPPTYKISVQGVTTAGIPDGTIKGGGSPASQTFTPPADTTWNNTWRWITLANSYTSAGEPLAFVIAYDSGTVGAGNNSAINTTLVSAPWRVPYINSNNNGSRTRSALLPLYGYRTSTEVYGYPVTNFSAASYSSDSTPDEYALRFNIPTDFCDTYTVIGLRAYLRIPAAAKTVNINLYDTDGTTVLQQVAWDTDISTGAATTAMAEFYFPDNGLSTLDAGSTYRIGFQPQDTSTSLGLYTISSTDNASLGYTPFGTAWYLDTRTNAGAWTDNSTVNLERPYMELILGDWNIPAASAGGGAFVFA